MKSAAGKATIALFASKGLGLVREGALLLLAATKPDAVNVYFIASQCGMGLKEKGVVQLYFVVIALITIATGDLIRCLLFLTILFPFWFWPGVLARINDRFGLYGVIILTAAFNISSTAEILLVQQFPVLSNYPVFGAPVMSLWLVVMSCALTFGLKPVVAYDRVLVVAIAVIVMIRLALLTGVLDLGDSWIVYGALRFAELTVPQFANYQRVFRG